MDPIETTAYVLSLMTLLSHVAFGVGLAVLLFSKKTFYSYLVKFKPYFFSFAFTVALVATLGSLFFSEIAKYNPCTLCWYQRILMYPLVLLLGLSLIKKEKIIVDYVLSMSVLGTVVALYHYLLQINLVPSVVCSVVGYSASCSQRFEMEYGYITIPMMSLTAFFIISLLMFFQKRSEKFKK